MANILVCDDDKAIVEAIEIYLTQEGYHILKAYDGQEALDILNTQAIDLLIIDIMMPRLDGIRATVKIRESNPLPIIILSAKSEDTDKILGLNIGADDYITKPFSLMVLRARIEKVLKKQTSSTEYQDENYHFYFERMEFFFNDTPVELSKTEQKLLKILVFNRNQVVTREILIDRIWSNGAEFVDENALSVTVNRLRKKLDAGNRIQTVYGIGYTWRNE